MGKNTMVRALPVAMEPRGPRATPTSRVSRDEDDLR
jgi:hypothetical protein